MRAALVTTGSWTPHTLFFLLSNLYLWYLILFNVFRQRHILQTRICSVSDPYSFFTDPDPEVEAGDQYGSGYGSGSRALMTKNLKKITAEKKNYFFFDQKLHITYP